MLREPTFAEPKTPAPVPWGKPPPAPWNPPPADARPPLPTTIPKTTPIDLTRSPKPDFLPNGKPNLTVPKPAPGGFPKPKFNPHPTPVSPGPKVPNFKAIGRQVAWDILNPDNNADGTVPDFNRTLPKPKGGPERSTKPDIMTNTCLPAENYGLPPGSNGFIAQSQLFYRTSFDGIPWWIRDPTPPSWKEDYGYIHLVRHDKSEPLTAGNLTALLRHGVKSKSSFVSSNGTPYSKYTMWYQRYGVIGGTGEEWEGDYTIEEFEVQKRYDKGPDYYTKYPPGGTVLQRGTTYDQHYIGRVFFCPGEGYQEPQDDNDYDRNEDEDDMPCKWKPANDPNVESLEMIDFDVKHFKGCEYNYLGEPDFFETKTVQFPKGIGESMVKMYDRQSEIQAQFCELPLSPMVLPDWMPLKWGNVEKLVVLYAVEKDGKRGPSKYSITIPHWSRSESQTNEQMFPSYNKGNWCSIMEHSDGSRVTINANSKSSAEEVMNTIRGHLEPPWRYTKLENAGLRRGAPIQDNYVVPTEARYYEAGTESITPLWTKKFR